MKLASSWLLALSLLVVYAILAVSCYCNNIWTQYRWTDYYNCTIVDFDEDSDVEVESDTDEGNQQEGKVL